MIGFCMFSIYSIQLSIVHSPVHHLSCYLPSCANQFTNITSGDELWILTLTMSSTIGHIGEYEESREEWTQYAERLGHFLAANGIDAAEKKRSVFLSVVGPKTYNLLGSLLAPAKPGEKSYDELIDREDQ